MAHAPGDLRSYLAELEAAGDLARITESVDWDQEIGALSRIGLDRQGPALLFERIRGYPEGYRVAANLIGPARPRYARLAQALGLPRDTAPADLIEYLAARLEQRIDPVRVEQAPCQEVVYTDQAVDLLRLPVPKVHGLDGGRYLGTWHLTVTRDPDTGWTNWGMYRHEVHGPNRLGFLANPAQHGPAMFYQKYEARNQPMPIAIAIGTDPVAAVVAGSQVPAGVDEARVVGGLTGRPVELVPCLTVDLEVPANAEIVVEGTVLPHERHPEGTFGEFTGYTAGGRVPRPTIAVSAVTHRRRPILTMSNMGKPWDEFSVMASLMFSAQLVRDLRGRGLPFQALYVPPPILSVVVACDPPYPGYVHTLASAIWASKVGVYRPYIFVVGADVDVFNAEDVFWCLTTRLHPRRGIHVLEGTPALPLWPFLDGAERERGWGSKALFDCTFPRGWVDPPAIVDFRRAWDPAVQERALARWQAWGLDRRADSEAGGRPAAPR